MVDLVSDCLNLERNVSMNQRSRKEKCCSPSTGSIPGGLTPTLALHKWRSKIATFKTPLYL